MKELLALCEKHKLAIVPTYEGNEVNFHDSMTVVKFTKDVREFIFE
jgi:hypothetical protein